MTNKEVQEALEKQKQEAEEERWEQEKERLTIARKITELLLEHLPHELLLETLAEALGTLSIEDAQEVNMKAATIKALRPFQLLVQNCTIEKDGERYIDTSAIRENIENEPAFAEIKRVMDIVKDASKEFMTELAKEKESELRKGRKT